MMERPILFSGPMVRALLDGRKTQTRRVIKGVPSWDHYGRDIMDWGLSGIHQDTYDPHNPIEGTDRWHLDVQTDVDDHSRRVIRCPYGAPGDRLWVRETWHYINHQNGPRGLEVCVGYPADGDDLPNRPSHLVPDPERWADKVDAWPYKHRRWPAIHMPRWASRITLQITDVRVERLNDISRADAIAEGLRLSSAEIEEFWRWPPPLDAPHWLSPPAAYRWIWEHINGEGSWALNPWVWVVSFEVVR